MKAFFVAALAALTSAQINSGFNGTGNIYIVHTSQDWPWGPDSPASLTVGCLNGDGKLVAQGPSSCGTFVAKSGSIYSSKTGNQCGGTPRTGGEGAQPNVFNCQANVYTTVYRAIGNEDKPDYLSYGAGYLGWTADGPGQSSPADIYSLGWTYYKVLLWFKKF
ncbi:hypothetical protein F5Y17DRAFT_462058 [Xylariaceae sp. FL0594]|nr:hypothetical protein F5Y17DRAFT_462058 [Xylariaceae sp. FL0594]